MKYVIADDVFEKLPDVIVGVVAVKGADNTKPVPEIEAMLEENYTILAEKLNGVKVKELPDVQPYREAFRTLGMNPNKFTCSAEALLTRISKGKGMPSINPLVDLNNAVSIKYEIPMGTHDLDTMHGEDLEVRFAVDGDTFLPFGSTETETPEAGELVYVCGHEVRTRRWTWRQSEIGKIDEQTKTVIYPIDGFAGFNEEKVLAARDELAELLKQYFGAEVITGFVDKDHPSFEIEF